MKKALALILGTVMVGTVAAGFVGCKNKKPSNPTVAGFKRLADPRDQGAFEVYSKDDKKIGSFPSIARAINAAVEHDLDDFESAGIAPTERGSYVTKKGSTRKIFENMIKYSDAAAEDNYWYYEDNALSGYEYWETGVPFNRAQNTKNVTYQVQSGTTASVAASSYSLYDGNGQLMDPSTYNLIGSSWEIIPMTDANIKGVPVRDAGATGAKYVLDLSDVKIKPAYAGVKDDVYAFFGYTIGAGSYSTDVGLACNVNTGEWKQYISYNPNNRVGGEGSLPEVTVEYNIGKTVFGSKWNKEGGYFTPNVDSVTIEIKEVKDEDGDGEEWWYDQLDITLNDATKPAVTMKIDDEFLIDHGNVGAAFDNKNGFYFSAGLDIVAPGAKLGDGIEATDYTIGATFENLVVEEAYIYFPTEEEVSDADYGVPISPELRGQYHSIRAGFEGKNSGIYNYTILALNSCIDYELTDGKDTYSFRYDNYEITSEPFSGELKTYQDKIDAVASITKETAGSYQTALDELIDLLGPDGDAEKRKVGDPATGKMPAHCYYVVDWEPFFDAYEVFLSAVKLTETGTQFLNEFKALSAINNVADWKGWKAQDGAADKKGYLWDELQVFADLATRYEELIPDDKSGIRQLVGELWYAWLELYEDYTAMLETGSEFATKEFTITNLNMTGKETMTGSDLVSEFFRLAFDAYNVTKNDMHTQHGGALCVEISNNGAGQLVNQHFYTNFRMFFIEWYLKEQGIQIGYCKDVITMLMDHCLESGSGSYHDFQYIANVSKQLERILSGECNYLDEELAEMINTYMVGATFQNGTWDWALSVGGGDLNDRGYNWKSYFGIETGKTFRNLIHEYLKPIILRDSDATMPDRDRGTQGVFPGMAVSKKVTAIDFSLSPAAIAWENAWKELNDITKLDGWKGWSNSDTTDKSYIANAMATALELISQYNGLDAADKTLLAPLYSDAMDVWTALNTDYTALKANSKMVAIWDDMYDTQTNTKVSDIFEAFVDHAMFHNTSGCTNQQGYLCMEHPDCGKNSVYTLYLNKMLEEAQITMGYWSDLVELLKNQGESNGTLNGLKAGAGNFRDYDYVYYMGKQIGRIVRGEVDYLDAELAEAVNGYMVANHTNSGSGFGTYNCFYNGTWCYFYYNSTMGKIKGYNVDWMKAIDADLARVAGGNSTDWASAIKYVTDILDEAGYGNLLVGAGLNHQAPAMCINGPVEAQLGINDLDSIEATVEGVTAIFNAMNFHDLTDPTAWTGGASEKGKSKGYIYDEVQMFAKIYAVYNTLNNEDKAAVKAACETFEAWIDLLTAYNALGTTKNISIVNAELNGYEMTSELDLVNEFFNIVFKTYDATIAHAKTGNKFGFLCGEHETCFVKSMRALYLNKMIELNIADFDLVADMLDAMANLESTGNSKYTGITETANMLLDFEYLWNMSAQINRILSGKCTYLDAELVAAINKYMYGDVTNQFDGSNRCAGSFYSLALSDDFRNNGGKISTTTGWEMYFGLPASEGNWGELIKNVTDLILADSRYTEAVLVATTSETNTYKMLTNTELEAATPDLGDLEGIDSAEDLLAAFEDLELTDLTDMTPNTWKGGKSANGNEKGYIYDEVMMFKNVYLAYLALESDEQTTALADETFKAWVDLYLAYDALSTYKNISVPNEALTGYTTMSAFEVVNEFFNNLFASYHDKIAHTSTGNKFGYLCLEDEDCFKYSMRALYLYKMLEVKGIEFDLADDMLDAAAKLESTGYSKYTSYTETKNAILDFEYLWNMSAQIKRIRDTKLKSLDAELVEAINTYMYVADDDPAKVKDGNARCASSFYHMSLSSQYRNNSGKISTVTGWGLYFGLNADEDNWSTLIKSVTDIINRFYKEESVLISVANGAMLTNQEVTEHTFTISPEAEAIIEAFHGLGELDKLSLWKGWTGTEAGYVAYELGLFKGLLEQLKALDEGEQAIVLEDVDANKWALWNTLATEYAALVENQDSITIFNSTFTEQTTSKTKAELLVMFVDGAFWAKKNNKIDGAQGYFYLEDTDPAINAVYTMYLYEILVENDVDIAYLTTVINMIKSVGQDFVSDYDYIWNVGKQIARIINTELGYIDAELAAVVNEYMVVTGNKSNFNNGTWSYFYGNGGPGYINPKVGSTNWLKAIDESIYTVVGSYSGWAGSNWNLAMAYLTGTNGLLTRAGYSTSYKTIKDNVNALFLSETVAVQKDPDALESVEEIKEFYDTLHDLTDVTPGTWLGGASGTANQKQYQARYYYDEAMMFKKVVNSATKLNKVAEVKEQIGAANYERWESLVAQFEALSTENNIEIVNGGAASVGGTVTVSELTIVKGFFNALFQTFDSDAEHTPSASTNSKAFGYLCMSDKTHFLMSMRALYLHKLIEVKEMDFDFADDVLDAVKKYGNGETEDGNLKSKYTYYTEAENSVRDFEYLWTMAAQIKRIKAMDAESRTLDDELRGVVDGLITSYMIEYNPSNKYAGQLGCANYFYNLGLCARYRDTAEIGYETDWELYLGLDATETWSQCLATYINPLLAAEYDFVFTAAEPAKPGTPMMYKKKAATDPQPDVQA